MDRFEQELQQALADRKPPDGFTERVMARTVTPPARTNWGRSIRAAVALLAIMAALPIGLRFDQQRRHQLEAENAKQQLLQALRITRENLEAVEGQLLEAQH